MLGNVIQRPSQPSQLIAATLAASGASLLPCSPSLIQPEHLSFCITTCGLNFSSACFSPETKAHSPKRMGSKVLNDLAWNDNLWPPPRITSKSDYSPFPGHAPMLCSCPSFPGNVPVRSGLTAVCQHSLLRGPCFEVRGGSIFHEW